MDNEPKGKAKGGLARAAKLTPERRKEIAKKGATARWSYVNEDDNLMEGKLLRAITDTAELKIGDLLLHCAVLEDETRVLSERSVIKGLGGKRAGSHWKRMKENPDGAYLPIYASAKNLKPFINNDLALALSKPLIYLPRTGYKAYGLRGEVLPQICEIWLEARDAGVLKPHQLHIAEHADILIRGLARVGIIALIDEATGYQEMRDRQALYKILDAYVMKEFLPWAKRFGDEFYREMFRLRGWKFNPFSVKRPILVAKLTTQITYDRLPPGVKEEIQRKNPKSEKTGKYKHKYFQYLTTDLGIPHLDKLLTVSTAFMKIASTWRQFMDMYNRVVPKPGTTPPLFPMENGG